MHAYSGPSGNWQYLVRILCYITECVVVAGRYTMPLHVCIYMIIQPWSSFTQPHLDRCTHTVYQTIIRTHSYFNLVFCILTSCLIYTVNQLALPRPLCHSDHLSHYYHNMLSSNNIVLYHQQLSVQLSLAQIRVPIVEASAFDTTIFHIIIIVGVNSHTVLCTHIIYGAIWHCNYVWGSKPNTTAVTSDIPYFINNFLGLFT